MFSVIYSESVPSEMRRVFVSYGPYKGFIWRWDVDKCRKWLRRGEEGALFRRPERGYHSFINTLTRFQCN